MSIEDDVLAMAAEDSEKPVDVTDNDLDSVAVLAERQLTLSREIQEMEELVKEKKKELQKVEEQDLPEAMDRLNLSEFKLKDGTKIKISTFYNASIPGERKEEAFSWLDEHGHGPLIKAEVKVPFDRGELEMARQFVEFVREHHPGLEAEFNQSVHWQTLRAFVREQVESGAALPLDLFGVYVGRKAKITEPKRK